MSLSIQDRMSYWSQLNNVEHVTRSQEDTMADMIARAVTDLDELLSSEREVSIDQLKGELKVIRDVLWRRDLTSTMQDRRQDRPLGILENIRFTVAHHFPNRENGWTDARVFPWNQLWQQLQWAEAGTLTPSYRRKLAVRALNDCRLMQGDAHQEAPVIQAVLRQLSSQRRANMSPHEEIQAIANEILRQPPTFPNREPAPTFHNFIGWNSVWDPHIRSTISQIQFDAVTHEEAPRPSAKPSGLGLQLVEARHRLEKGVELLDKPVKLVRLLEDRDISDLHRRSLSPLTLPLALRPHFAAYLHLYAALKSAHLSLHGDQAHIPGYHQQRHELLEVKDLLTDETTLETFPACLKTLWRLWSAKIGSSDAYCATLQLNAQQKDTWLELFEAGEYQTLEASIQALADRCELQGNSMRDRVVQDLQAIGLIQQHWLIQVEGLKARSSGLDLTLREWMLSRHDLETDLEVATSLLSQAQSLIREIGIWQKRAQSKIDFALLGMGMKVDGYSPDALQSALGAIPEDADKTLREEFKLAKQLLESAHELMQGPKAIVAGLISLDPQRPGAIAEIQSAIREQTRLAGKGATTEDKVEEIEDEEMFVAERVGMWLRLLELRHEPFSFGEDDDHRRFFREGLTSDLILSGRIRDLDSLRHWWHSTHQD